MNAFRGQDAAANGWPSPQATADYQEQVSYDPNGNIMSYQRNRRTTAMDNLSYSYTANTNKLRQVTDAVAAGNYTEDVDNQASVDNYTYDLIGNLKSDAQEGIGAISWTVYGKIRQITKGTTTIVYRYDASGNRTSKAVTIGSTTTTTYYVRDAQGNVMAVYEKQAADPLRWTEQHLYGSSRLGMWTFGQAVPAATTAPAVGSTLEDGYIYGTKFFELSNHLGNVLATVSDKKIGVDDGNNGTTDYFNVDVVSAQDYYPFGMVMPGRKFAAPSSSYRYGFNGKENDNEVKGEGNQQDYGMRIYDPRVGRFLSVDPLTKQYPWYTPYQFAGNRPIIAIDIDGLEPHDVNSKELKREFSPSAANGKPNSDPVVHGSNAKPWSDLINFKIPIDLIRARNLHATEQKIEDSWGSLTNLDYYTVQISRLPDGIKDGGELLESIRLNLGKFLDNKTSFSGYSSDGSDMQKWQSGNPLGSIMSFDANFEDPILGAYWNLDDASVMTSSYSRNSDGGFWIFSTLSTTGDGYHPIAGSRQFGVSSNSNGGYTFYIRAADRAFDAATNIFGGENRVFKSAEVTWNAVCRNIFMYVNNSGGKALTPSTPISKRVPWDSVQGQIKQK